MYCRKLVGLLVASFAMMSLSVAKGQEQSRACCLPDDSCTDATLDECQAQGGASGATGTSCAAFNCGCDVDYGCSSACCFDDGNCFDSTAPDCVAAGGSPQSAGNTCGNFVCECTLPSEECAYRPCCLPDGSCAELPKDQCIVREGYPGTVGETCQTFACGCPDDPDGCLIACLFPDDQERPCEDLHVFNCRVNHGELQEPGCTCEELPCGSCGDDFCDEGAGETTCTCPTDCGPGSCGDGICCAAEGEDTCNCPGDCGGTDCNDDNVCTDDACDPVNGCSNTDNSARCNDDNVCTDDACDPVDGCSNTDNSARCNDDNVCTDDACDPVDGCSNTDNSARCNDNNVCTDDACDPVDGCSNTDNSARCNDDNPCTDDACDPQEGCTHTDNGTCAQVTCRTPGFWSTHACGTNGTDCEKRNSKNLTQAALNACGGCIEVCGDVINTTVLSDSDSALEAMCVAPSGASILQLARQLSAASLNCCISGAGAGCSGIGIEAVFNACNAACTRGDTTVMVGGAKISCVNAIDCFNNGGHYDADSGECLFRGDNCHERELGVCANGAICTESSLCADGSLCGAPGPAGSSRACNAATGNMCYVIGDSSCRTGGANGAQNCP